MGKKGLIISSVLMCALLAASITYSAVPAVKDFTDGIIDKIIARPSEEDPSSELPSSEENSSSEFISSEDESSISEISSEVSSSEEPSSVTPVEVLPAVLPYFQEQYDDEGFTLYSNSIRAQFGIGPGTAAYASLNRHYLTHVADSDGENAAYSSNSARVQTVNTPGETSADPVVTTFDFRLGWTSATAAVTSTDIPAAFFQGKSRAAYVMTQYSLINYGSIQSNMQIETTSTSITYGMFVRGESDMTWKSIDQNTLANGEKFQVAFALAGSADSKSVVIKQFGITLNSAN